MDDTIVTIPGNIVHVKFDKNKNRGLYIYISDVLADPIKKNWWSVRFFALIETGTPEPVENSWLLDDQQIRGEEFTMDGTVIQLFKTNFTTNQIINEQETKVQKDNIEPFKSKYQTEKIYLAVDNTIPIDSII
jgi:hypothetical protein